MRMQLCFHSPAYLIQNDKKKNKKPPKPAPTLHTKNHDGTISVPSWVRLLYHHGFYILQVIPPSRTLPTSPAIAVFLNEA